MLKKRAESRKKKTNEQLQPKTKRLYQIQIGQKYSTKKTNFFGYKGNPYSSIKSSISTPNNFISTKSTKSSNATPNSKSRKSSKQNIQTNMIYPIAQLRRPMQNLLTVEIDDENNPMSSTINSQFLSACTGLNMNSSHISNTNNISSLNNNMNHTNSINKRRMNYNFIYQIGSGGFGRVWKVEDKKQHKIYAMKEMSKIKIINKKSITSIMNQKQLLEQLKSNFIINSCYNFQDRENLYLVMQYLKGGDLRYHMCFYQYFDEDQTKFITACIVAGLQYIHSKNVIHRDLKPQNIVFEENGYARITDFGVARKKKQNNAEETSGTPGYMSPEVICRLNHSYQSDFFALGVIVYELMFGTRPYMGDSRKQIRQKILAHQAKIHDRDLPTGWNPSCIDFVNRLLKRNKQTRLGYNGINQIKNHPWLKTINWPKLQKKQLYPPFIPGIICQSLQYQREMQASKQTQMNEETAMLLRTQQVQKLFRKYDTVVKKQQKKPHFFQNQVYRKLL